MRKERVLLKAKGEGREEDYGFEILSPNGYGQDQTNTNTLRTHREEMKEMLKENWRSVSPMVQYKYD